MFYDHLPIPLSDQAPINGQERVNVSGTFPPYASGSVEETLKHSMLWNPTGSASHACFTSLPIMLP
ncbi:hypothetical protein DESC_290146 [Desulfosarcina cetonica]|nr:hypothetical protein DESC_290146 [Desulfosarcina cetonica]